MTADAPSGPSRYSRSRSRVLMCDSAGLTCGKRLSTRRLMPPPQGLLRGKPDRSSRRTGTPARASVRAAVAPAGPAPTTVIAGSGEERAIMAADILLRGSARQCMDVNLLKTGHLQVFTYSLDQIGS